MNVFEFYEAIKEQPQNGDQIQMTTVKLKIVNMLSHNSFEVTPISFEEESFSHASLYRGARLIGSTNEGDNN